MTNSLIKNTTIETIVGTEEIPAIPFVPATPPRTVYESRTVCGMRYSGPGHYVFSTDRSTGQTTMMFVPDATPGSGGISVITATWGCSTERVPVTFPGTPAQPYVPGHSVATSSLVTGYNLGWNAGGRSIRFFNGDGFVEFKVRASVVGVICGINFYDGIDSGYNGNTIDFAFYLARGHAWIMRNGALGAAVGLYDDTTVFRIERTGTSVVFSKDGTAVATISSGVPTEPGWLEASLYSGDDEVFDPVLTAVSAPDLSERTATLDASLDPFTFFGATGPYAELDGEIDLFEFDAQAGLATPAFAVGDFQLPPLFFSGTSLTGEVATLDASLPPLEMLASDHPYAEMFAELDPFEIFMNAYEGRENASMASQAFVDARMAPMTFLVVTMSSSGVLTAAQTVDVIIPAEMRSEAILHSTLASSAILDAVMASLATSGAVLGVPDSDSETWVMNLATQGTTTYTGFGFNSFALIGQRYYGAGPEGIFALEGDTDAGQPIRANISLGKLDFGTAMQKTISHAYIGMSAQGNLFMKVRVGDGDQAREYIYKTRSFSSSLQQQRIVAGKGLKANYVEVELYNEDGADFEVDTVEFHVADLKRRI